MADYEDYDEDDFDFGSLPEIQQQHFLYNLIGFKTIPQDTEAHNLFWELMYNDNLNYDERQEAYQQLSDYLYDEYGLMFDDIWDWEDFRSWYENA